MKSEPVIEIKYERIHQTWHARGYEETLLKMFGEFLLAREARIHYKKFKQPFLSKVITMKGRRQIKVKPLYQKTGRQKLKTQA